MILIFGSVHGLQISCTASVPHRGGRNGNHVANISWSGKHAMLRVSISLHAEHYHKTCYSGEVQSLITICINQLTPPEWNSMSQGLSN